MATYRIDVPSSGGSITAATLQGGCTAQDFQTSDDEGFRAIISQGHFLYDGSQIKMTASTNSSGAERSGYMTVSYTIGGNSCSNRIYLVQANQTGTFKLTINVPQGVTSPAFRFLDASNNILFSHTRSNGVVGEVSTWSTTGTCTQMQFYENGGNLSSVTLMDNNGTRLINNQSLNQGSTTTNISLTSSFNTSDYGDGNKSLSLTFS